jgi:hypothetical protein
MAGAISRASCARANRIGAEGVIRHLLTAEEEAGCGFAYNPPGLLVLGVSLITSKGAHGVPGSAIVILAATLNAVPSIPAIGLVLVLSVDWFIGMARALGNLIGNCVATVVVAAWEGDLDRAKAKRDRGRRTGRCDRG